MGLQFKTFSLFLPATYIFEFEKTAKNFSQEDGIRMVADVRKYSIILVIACSNLYEI